MKVALADAVHASIPTRDLGALASDAMWRLAVLIDGPCLIESFWAPDRDEAHLEAGLRIGGFTRGIEVFCAAPLPTMRDRFRTRLRHRAHDDDQRLSEWEERAAAACPVSAYPVIHVDTSGPVDIPGLAARIRESLA